MHVEHEHSGSLLGELVDELETRTDQHGYVLEFRRSRIPGSVGWCCLRGRCDGAHMGVRPELCDGEKRERTANTLGAHFLGKARMWLRFMANHQRQPHPPQPPPHPQD